MRTLYWLLVLAAAVVLTALVTQRAIGVKAQAASATPTAGEAMIAPVGTIKDVMKGIVDPNATAVWNSVSTESGPNGVIEKVPQNDDEWSEVEHHALAVAEAANLLLTPGRAMSRPEEANSTSQPGAPELTPAQIQEKIAQNPAEWATHAHGLQTAAVKAIEAARMHDKDRLLDVGEDIDNACESCHTIYWYPDQPKL